MSMKEKLKELQSQYGGLIGGSIRSTISEGTSVLVVGVGGMGVKSVNKIAKEYHEHFEDTGSLSLLAIDTNQDDLTKIMPISGGYVDAQDTFALYDAAVKAALKFPRTEYIQSFVSNELPSTEIGPLGANGIRCVGRVMLCASPKYAQLLNELRDRINHMKGHKQVILIAGISGGTGSGTFIDIGYMLEYLTRDQIDTNLFGVFYMPDVQRNEEGIKGNAAVWGCLEKNGYAALKELDYFMGVGSQGQGDVYKLKLQYPFIGSLGNPVHEMTSDRPILQEDKVFLVSATEPTDSCISIVTDTAISLLNMFRRSIAQTDDGQAQSVLGNICNKAHQRLQWYNTNIGATNNTEPNDSAKMAHTDLPAFLGYHYSSLGYRSVYIPRNEMAAYCLSLILNDLFENQFAKRIDQVTPEYVAQMEAAFQLDSIDSIIDRIKSLCNVNDSGLRLLEGTHGSFPVGGLHLKNGQEAIDEELSLAVEKCNGLQTAILTEAVVEGVWAYFNGLIDQNLFDNDQLWTYFGPYGVVALLSGHDSAGGRIQGLIDHLAYFATTGIANKISELQKTCDEKLFALTTEKKAREADLVVDKKEIVRFVDLCEEYGKAAFNLMFAQNIAQPMLVHLHNYVNALNNRTFATYLPMLDVIKEIVNNDTNGFMSGGFAHDGNVTKYVVNAFSLDQDLKNNELFQSFFANYINNPEIGQAKNDLIAKMFSKANRKFWESLALSDAERIAEANGDANAVITDSKIRTALRGVFNGVTGPLVGQMLQMMIVMIYCDPTTFRHVIHKDNNEPICLQDLVAYWNNDPAGRDIALDQAATRIVAELKKGDMIALNWTISAKFNQRTSRHMEVCSIPELGDLDANTENNLNKQIKSKLPEYATFGLFPGATGGVEPRTEICSYQNTPYIPLPFVDGMKEYARIYHQAESVTVNAVGRHGDEVTEKWHLYMPEIYGVDAEDFYLERGIARFERTDFPKGNHDRERYEEIRQLADYAFENGIIYLDAGRTYHLFMLKTDDEQITDVNDFLEKIRNQYGKMAEKKDGESELSWRNAVLALEAERTDPGCYHEDILLVRSLVNTPLTAAQAETILPEDRKIQHLHRVIRQDLRTQTLLKNTVSFFKENRFFEAIAEEQKSKQLLQEVPMVVGHFLAAYRMGAIEVVHSAKANKDFLVYKKTGKPSALVDLSLLDKDIDVDFKWFLAVSIFSKKVFENKELRNELKQRYIAFLADKSSQPLDWRSDVYAKLKSARDAKSDIVMKPIHEGLGSAYSRTGLRDGYSYPTAIKAGNAESLGKLVLANIDVVLEAMQKRVPANDAILCEKIDGDGPDEVIGTDVDLEDEFD